MTDINVNEALTRRAIVRLLTFYAEWVHEDKPKAKEIAKARFVGYFHGLHFLLELQGISSGSAPFSVELDLLEATRANGEPPRGGGSSNEPYKVWVNTITLALLTKWVEGAREFERARAEIAARRRPPTAEAVNDFLDGLVAGGTTNIA
jgi:hypothetical protein